MSFPPAPVNETVRTYAPGSAERIALKARLADMADQPIEIPLVIGGREVRSRQTATAVMPFNGVQTRAVTWRC